MRVLQGYSANDVYAAAIEEVLTMGSHVPSRVAPTLELHPFMFEIKRPMERLVTSPGRPVNLAFALAEVLWILGGRNDVEMLQHYNSNIARYSDDGQTFNAAYGARLRHTHGWDQLNDVIRLLADEPDSRQANLVISHPLSDRAFLTEEDDVRFKTEDRACNVYAHLMIRNGALDWLQIVRSNDAMWGVPYNFIQWMSIMEYVATALEVPLGTYRHLADSLHIYDYHWSDAKAIRPFDLYAELEEEPLPMEQASYELIEHLLGIEHAIRQGERPALLEALIRDLPQYWLNVMAVLSSWAFYKRQANGSATKVLGEACTDRAWSATMVRFFWHHRFSKSESAKWWGDGIRDSWEPRVANWILEEPIGGTEE